MKKQIAVLALPNDVWIHLPVSIDTKHYSQEQAKLSLEVFARQIGAEFVYLDSSEQEEET